MGLSCCYCVLIFERRYIQSRSVLNIPVVIQMYFLISCQRKGHWHTRHMGPLKYATRLIDPPSHFLSSHDSFRLVVSFFRNYITTRPPCPLHFMHGILPGWMIGGGIVNSVVALVFQWRRRPSKVKTGDDVKSSTMMECIATAIGPQASSRGLLRRG